MWSKCILYTNIYRMEQFSCLSRRQPWTTGPSIKMVDRHIIECSVLESSILSRGVRKGSATLSGTVWKQNPLRRKRQFQNWALPCRSLSLFNSDSYCLLVLLIFSLRITTTIWEESSFRRGLGKRNIVYITWGHFWFLAWHIKTQKSSLPSTQQEQNWTNWKPTALLKSFWELRSQGKPLPLKLDRQVDTENYNSPGAEVFSENNTREGKPKRQLITTGGSVRTSLRIKHSWEAHTGMSFTSRSPISFLLCRRR